MALKTLKGVEKIGGFEVIRSVADKLQMAALKDRPFIEICHNAGTITFKVQDKPIKEGGVNGCQVDTILETVLHMIEGLNKGAFNCNENLRAIGHIKEALGWLSNRRMKREKNGVEGTSKP
jgi:hypothetical protein